MPEAKDRPARSPATSPAQRRSHQTARDLERYAGLFAQRTRVMRSSAMRDLMTITARPDVISLAGGLPDTSTFPRTTVPPTYRTTSRPRPAKQRGERTRRSAAPASPGSI
jgi:hypothetical protein